MIIIKESERYPDASVEAAENFCRNPDGRPEGPWCFVEDAFVEWEQCDVPLCTGIVLLQEANSRVKPERQCSGASLVRNLGGPKTTHFLFRTFSVLLVFWLKQADQAFVCVLGPVSKCLQDFCQTSESTESVPFAKPVDQHSCVCTEEFLFGEISIFGWVNPPTSKFRFGQWPNGPSSHS